jgi:hypothetical protein
MNDTILIFTQICGYGRTQSRVTDDFLFAITAAVPELDAAKMEAALVLCEEAR